MKFFMATICLIAFAFPSLGLAQQAGDWVNTLIATRCTKLTMSSYVTRANMAWEFLVELELVSEITR